MRVWMLALVATLAAECTRAPAEDFPSRSTPSPSAGPAPAAASAVVPTLEAPAGSAGRCMLPTPSQAPAALPPGPAPGCPVDPEGGPPKVPVVHVAFPDATRPGGVAVEAELVVSPHDTERGLMYRKSMPEDHGMLFDLRTRDEHPFWMHNTCIPLDLIHIDEDGFVVGIIESAPTLNDAPRTVGCPGRYVLEVNAGWSRRHGVKAGQHMTIPPEAR
ncbi:MAG: DUF192 domain-containing protein [Polyangiaceae bacterium]